MLLTRRTGSDDRIWSITELEALACGKPVLAGNMDGATDPLLDGELGCLVDPDDVEAIAECLIQILHRTYPQELLYKPQLLRRRTMARFAQDQFRNTLALLMESLVSK